METEVAEKLAVGAQEAAAMVSICPKSLWNHTEPRGTIPSFKIGARRLYAVEDLRRWIDAQKRGADMAPPDDALVRFFDRWGLEGDFDEILPTLSDVQLADFRRSVPRWAKYLGGVARRRAGGDE